MLGDGLAQTKVECKEQLDRRRLFATGAYAGLIVGPIGHGWYSGLDTFVLRYWRPATFAFIATKVIIDEVVFTPIHIAAFFTFLTMVEGGNFEACKAKLRKDYLPTLLTEMAIWPVPQAINFWKVPVKHQLLVINAATVVDSTFLCWARSQDDWLSRIWPGKDKLQAAPGSLEQPAPAQLAQTTAEHQQSQLAQVEAATSAR